MNPVVAVQRLLSGFSFKEKSLLVSLAALVVVYGGYFAGVLAGRAAPTLTELLGTMISLVIALVMIHVVFHIVIALDDADETEDERDRAVRRRASLLGYNVLFVAVLLIAGRLLVVGARMEGDGLAAAMNAVEMFNLLLAALVLAEVVYYGAQLVFYRRGFRD